MKKIPLDNQTFEHPWDEKLIENVGSVIVGGTPSTSIDKYWGNDTPWMSSGDIHLKRIEDVPSRISILGLNSSNATLVDPPSVAIGLAGQGKTRGTVALVLMTLCTNQSVALIKCEENDLNIEYLFYNLESRYEELRSRSAGGGRAGLSKGILEKLTIPLPCIQEQDQIANVLSTIDLAITQTKAIIAKQQRIKTGLMQDLLTKGIDENGNIRSEATHEFKDSSIGRIPVEWEVLSLDNCVMANAPICYGILMPGLNYDAGVPVIKVKDIIGGNIIQDDLLLTDPKIDRQYKRSRLLERDLLVTIRGTTGRVALVPFELGGANITQDTARIRLTNKYSQDFVYFLIQSFHVQERISLQTLGQAVKGINISDLKKIQLPIPPLKEQEIIAQKITQITNYLQRVKEQLNKLHLTKTGLMQDLLTGKIRVTPLLEQEPASR